MDVSRTMLAIALCLVMSAGLSVAQGGRPTYDPAAQRPASKPRDSLADFALKHINPADTDYGQCLGEARSTWFDETIKSGYFWSNLIALGLVGCLFIIVVWQQRTYTRREWTISEVLAQYEQALARSNRQVEAAAKSNRSLAESLATFKQSAARPLAPFGDTVDRAAYRPTRSHSETIHGRTETVSKSDEPKLPAERPATARVTPGPSGQIALFKPEVELVTKVNALEQQLGHSHEMEKQLRRQLTETGRKLQAEQEKNRTVKGA